MECFTYCRRGLVAGVAVLAWMMFGQAQKPSASDDALPRGRQDRQQLDSVGTQRGMLRRRRPLPRLRNRRCCSNRWATE
jgi:hypothetical protein